MPRTQVDTALLQAALLGYEAQLAKIAAKIREIEDQLGHRRSGTAAPAATGTTKRRKRRPMSPEARARIIAAQRKRWAAYRREKQGRAKTGRKTEKPKVAAAGQ